MSYTIGEDQMSVELVVTATGYPEGVSAEAYVVLYTDDGSALGKLLCSLLLHGLRLPCS